MFSNHSYKATALKIVVVFMALLLTAGTACKRPPLARTWINESAKLHDISKIEITYNCGEKPIKAYDPLSASLWILRVHTRCPRADCIWGRAKGITNKDGSMTATFNTFSAVRTITIKDIGGLLEAKVFIDFRDKRQKSETGTYYLQPEE